MSKLLNIAFEEDETSAGGLGDPDGKPNELEKANNMVQNEDSTEPGNVVKIANYKEELAALKEQQGTQDETTDEASDPTEPSEDTGSTESTGDGSDDTDPDDDESTDGDESSEEPEEDETDSKDDSSDDAVDDEGMTDSDVDQLTGATESYTSMCKLHRVMVAAKERNSFSNTALEMLNISLENFKSRLGAGHVQRYEMPAMEDLSGITARQKYTDTMVVAFEGFLNDVWQAIVRMFKALGQWISDVFFKKRKSLQGAREDLKQVEVANKSLVKGLEKREELKGKTKNGQTMEEPFFSSLRAGDLLVPGKDPSEAKSINESFVLMNDAFMDQVTNLSNIADSYDKLIEDIFKATKPEDLVSLGARGFISSYLKTNGLEKTTMIPGEELTNFVAFKTPVLTLNTGYYYKIFERGNSKQGTDKNLVKQQRFGAYQGDDSNKGVKIPLINTKEQADKVVEWIAAIRKNRETLTAKGEALGKDIENTNKAIAQFKAIGGVVEAGIAELLTLICVILTNVVVKGYQKIDEDYMRYSKLLTAYHAEAVKEYGVS